MVSIAIPALAAMAASLPTGLGFGAGYGAGVRIGYDVLYPKLQPFAQELVSGIINAVRTVWSPGGPDTDIAEVAKPAGPDITKPPKTVAPTGRTRSAVDNCEVVKQRARSLQGNILALHRQLTGATGQSRRTSKRDMSNLKDRLLQKSNELNSILNDPANRSCVEGMKF